MSDSAVPTGVLGTSLALVHGDFVLASPDGSSALDLALVSGQANFVQAMGVMIGTPFGSDPVNASYGLDVAAIFTVAGTVQSIKDVIRLNLVKSLAADDRVREINDIVFDDDPDFATVAPDLAGGDPGAQARRARQWHAVALLTTVTSDQQRVVVSGASP